MKRLISRTLLILGLLAATGQTLWGAIVVEAFQQQNVLGFTTTGQYDAVEEYMVGATPWVARLNPLHAVELARGGTANFLAVLKAAFPAASGWSFKTAANDLSAGSLKVRSYDVDGNANRVGHEPGVNTVGFHVEYVPGQNDPTNNVHWIQVVTDNHNITNNPGHGNAENVVDIATGSTTPYYDELGAANNRHFLDAPARIDGNMSHTWIAELFLVTGPAPGSPGEVTIYNGLQWGWENYPVPEPASLVVWTGLAAVGLVAWRRRRRRAI